MAVESNKDDLMRDLRDLIDSFGFDATIEGKNLGQDCAGIVADGIAARSIDDESGPDGQWKPNAPEYAKWKARKYGVGKPNIRTGQMLSHQSLIGQTVITTASVEMNYGTGQPPTSSATGQGYDQKRDGEITDIEKAFFCSTTRPFYLLDDIIADRVLFRVDQCLQEYLVRA